MEPPPLGKIRINRTATASRDVPAYLAFGERGDDFGLLRKGAEVWLAFVEGEAVHYLSGHHAPVPGEIRMGGTIHRNDLDAVLDINHDTGRVTTPTIEQQLAALSPRDRARVMIEARIQILVDEAMATSAIEGIAVDPKEVRRAVLRRLAAEAGLG